MAPSILWFRRDLRLSDHPALHEAVRRGGREGVIPLFIIDDRFLAPSGPTRAAFLAACLHALEDSMGSRLVIRRGDPSEVLVDICQQTGARDVVVTGDFAPAGMQRDSLVDGALRSIDVDFVRASSPYAVDPGIVVGQKGQPVKVFTAFRRRWETIGPHVVLPVPDASFIEVDSTASIDDLVSLAGSSRPALFGDLPDGPPATLPSAGEATALEQLDQFVAEALDGYADGRNLFAAPGTSRLSPHLRFGTLHPRTALAAASGSGDGPAVFRSEIGWREFYADVLYRNPQSATSELQERMSAMEWDRGDAAEERFRTWARGETGIPLVDASMRQLLAEGWMHNRGRMLTASFLVKHLHLDWRWGARWFMWRLVDGDLASNTHGWQWTAGTGTDASPFYRVFSPIAQAERFDPQAEYIHRWVPELAHINAPMVFQPGGGVDLLNQAAYPTPMIDLAAERLEALRRLEKVKGAP